MRHAFNWHLAEDCTCRSDLAGGFQEMTPIDVAFRFFFHGK
jgi:hypothetical protein